MFLPSLALSCAILAWCYDNRTKPAALAILEQYKKSDPAINATHAQNTIINPANNVVIHYPTELYGTQMNSNVIQVKLPFKVNEGHYLLKNALKQPSMKTSLQNLTGLKELEVLIEIGKHFGNDVRFWAQNLESIAGVWLVGNKSLELSTDLGLMTIGAARGVRGKNEVGR